MPGPARAACLLAAGLALCACARSEGDVDATAAEPSPTAVMLEALFEGRGYRREASRMPREKLLAEIIAGARATASPAPVPTQAELDALARRLDIAIPPELAQVLQTPGALDALHWLSPARIERASALGDELASLLRASQYGAVASVTVEDLDGGTFQLPLADLRGYLVLARMELFGDVLLYDASEPPRHPCCRLLESPVLRNDSATGYRSLGDWLAMEWSLLRMRDE